MLRTIVTAFMNKLWPPTKTFRVSLLWALFCGFILSIAVPIVLAVVGFKDAALISIYPGLFPIIWATKGWFAGISPAGYLLMFFINTLVYGLPSLLAFRTCARTSNHLA